MGATGGEKTSRIYFMEVTIRPMVAAVIACGLFLSSCAHYQPSVLDPVQVESRFAARALDAPGLAEFARSQAGNPTFAWPPTALDPDNLLSIGLFFSTDVELARAEVAAKEAALVTAKQRINPTITVDAGRNKTPDSVATYSFSSAFTIETAGKRGLRILEAQKALEAARLRVWEAAWATRAKVRAALVAYYFAGVRLESLRAELAARGEIVTVWEKRLAAGEVGRPEVEAARADRAAVLLAIANADGALELGRAGIGDAVGVPTRALGSRAIDLGRLRDLPAPGELPIAAVRKAGLVHRADIRRVLAEYDAADVGLRLQLADRYPNVSLSPSYLFQEGFPSYVLGAALEALPVFHRGEGQVAERKAARDKIAVEFLALQAHVRDETDAALTKYRAAVAEWSSAGGVSVRLQSQREASVAAALKAGEADRLEVLVSKLGAFGVQRAEVDALERGQVALGDLEDAVQGALGGWMRMGEVK